MKLQSTHLEEMARMTCRGRFTPQDLEFVNRHLVQSGTLAGLGALERLWDDPCSRDLILDDPALAAGILDETGFLQVSAHFYFYVLVRRGLLRQGINDREVSDYLAAMLVAFLRQASASQGRRLMPYVSDLLLEMSQAGPSERFYLRARVADTTLFFSGLFEPGLRAFHDRRGGPDLSFYEQVGRSNYYYASRDRRAAERSLDGIFEHLSESFGDVRMALKTLSEEVLHLSEDDAWAGRVLST